MPNIIPQHINQPHFKPLFQTHKPHHQFNPPDDLRRICVLAAEEEFPEQEQSVQCVSQIPQSQAYAGRLEYIYIFLLGCMIMFVPAETNHKRCERDFCLEKWNCCQMAKINMM